MKTGIFHFAKPVTLPPGCAKLNKASADPVSKNCEYSCPSRAAKTSVKCSKVVDVGLMGRSGRAVEPN
jgi:hypothetical protein